MLPLLGPPFPWPLFLVTTSPQLMKLLLILAGAWFVIQLAQCAVIAYWLWRWGKDIKKRQRYLDEQDQKLDERARESERRHVQRMQDLHDLIERTRGGRWPGLNRE